MSPLMGMMMIHHIGALPRIYDELAFSRGVFRLKKGHDMIAAAISTAMTWTEIYSQYYEFAIALRQISRSGYLDISSALQ